MTGHVQAGRLGVAGGAERREILEHLAACAACRAAQAAADPSSLFALLALPPIPPAVLDAVSDGVRDAGAGAAAASRGAAVRRLAAAAVAAAALLTGTFTLVERPVRVAPAARAARADVEVAPAEAVSGVVDFTVGTTQVVMVYNGELRL